MQEHPQTPRRQKREASGEKPRRGAVVIGGITVSRINGLSDL
jgi:hypothetical protein